ncbi:uncharacterized protein [Halyomorpha halys]|uniref:uncharacterized protein n=1 Tax=Halyomorpha halys TaxID=286706 RepID=UPI0006D4FCF3|nr:uncharacterized protein LOC106691435 [Halyomorpha halys]
MMRRMKLIMLPIMYKLGVITTLLTLLTVFALKGLTIGVLLLVMSSAGLAAKFKYAHYNPHWAGPSKEVHVHVHGGGAQHSYHTPSIHYDDPWVREDRPQPEVANHQQWIHHQPPPPPPPPPLRSTTSPWASYIGDQSI